MIDNRQEAKKGMLWLGSATAVTRLLDIGATLIVFALLTREEMGTAALALGAGAIVESASGVGLGHALIQAQKLGDDALQSLFWLATLIGLGLGLVLGGVSPIVAWTYELPVLIPMISVLGLKMLLVGSALIPHQLLSKRLMFREAGAVQTLCSLVEGGSKIGFALLGFGAWALVLSGVVRGVVLLGSALYFSHFRPRLHFVWGEAKGFLNFGVRVAFSGVLYQAYCNADYFLVGKILGVEVLGLYRVSFELGMQPLMMVLTVINRVSYPIYAKIAHDTVALKSALLHSTRSMTLMGAPIVAFLFFAAADVLALVTSDRWAAAVPAIQLLVWGGLLRTAAHLFPQVYVAAGKPNFAVLDSAVSLVLLSSAFYLGLTFLPEWGVLSTCWAWILVYPVLLQLHLVLTRRILPLGTLEYLKALVPAIGGALAMILAMAVTIPLKLHLYGHLLSVIVWAAVGLGAYLVYLRVVLKMRFKDLLPSKQKAAAA